MAEKGKEMEIPDARCQQARGCDACQNAAQLLTKEIIYNPLLEDPDDVFNLIQNMNKFL